MRVHETKFYQEGIDDLIREGIAANSTAFLDTHGKVIGNPTEGALLLWLRDQGVDYAALRDGAKVVDQLTFTTERKFMATLVDSPLGGRYLYIKGAPEIVLNRCASFPDKTAVEAPVGGLPEYGDAYAGLWRTAVATGRRTAGRPSNAVRSRLSGSPRFPTRCATMCLRRFTNALMRVSV